MIGSPGSGSDSRKILDPDRIRIRNNTDFNNQLIFLASIVDQTAIPILDGS